MSPTGSLHTSLMLMYEQRCSNKRELPVHVFAVVSRFYSCAVRASTRPMKRSRAYFLSTYV